MGNETKKAAKTYTDIADVLRDLEAGKLTAEQAELWIRRLQPTKVVTTGGGYCRY